MDNVALNESWKLQLIIKAVESFATKATAKARRSTRIRWDCSKSSVVMVQEFCCHGLSVLLSWSKSSVVMV